jgi:hypothetical protein
LASFRASGAASRAGTARASMTAEGHTLTELDSGVRVVTETMD